MFEIRIFNGFYKSASLKVPLNLKNVPADLIVEYSSSVAAGFFQNVIQGKIVDGIKSRQDKRAPSLILALYYIFSFRSVRKERLNLLVLLFHEIFPFKTSIHKRI